MTKNNLRYKKADFPVNLENGYFVREKILIVQVESDKVISIEEILSCVPLWGISSITR